MRKTVRVEKFAVSHERCSRKGHLRGTCWGQLDVRGASEAARFRPFRFSYLYQT